MREPKKFEAVGHTTGRRYQLVWQINGKVMGVDAYSTSPVLITFPLPYLTPTPPKQSMD
jgi:hypothetical protein